MFRSHRVDGKNSLRGFLAAIILFLIVVLTLLFYEIITEEAQKCQFTETIQLINSNRSSEDYLNDANTNFKAKRLPQAIIIGTRKSGTRALLKFLEVNQAIRAAQNEVHFFDKPQNYKLGLDWYKSQMPGTSGNQLTIEKSPAYFVTPNVAERVKAMNSSIKLVLIFRNPVTRLVSDFSQLIANKVLDQSAGYHQEEFEYGGEGVQYHDKRSASNLNISLANSIWQKAEKEFESYVLRPDGGIDDERHAIKIGMYSNYLERWRALFRVEQFHFVDGESLIRNPYSELHKLELFLGIEPMIKPEDFEFNSQKGFYCLTTNIDKSNSGQLNLKHLNGSSKKSTSDYSGCLSKSKGRKHVSVRQEIIEALERFYAPYNEYLYSLTGIDFNWNKIK